MALNTSIIEREELMTLVPHKGKMFLLSRLQMYDREARHLIAEYDITPDCMFYDTALGGIPSWVSFECMAQSISALSGLMSREECQEPKLGFILSVSNLEIQVPVLPGGATIRIQVVEDCKVDQVFTFNCRVFLGPEQIAGAKLTVMEVADISLLGTEGYGNE